MSDQETNVKVIRTALDDLPFGDDEGDFGQNEKVTNRLPEGVQSKRLYLDIARIAWPSFVELMLTQLASMVDMMMVGKLGAWALTAVGLTTQPKFLLMTMFIAMNVGATAMVARYRGAGDRDRANKIVRQALMLNLILSFISSVLGFIFARPMIIFMGGMEKEVIDGAVVYLQIQMVGFMFMALTSSITAVLRGVGDSRTAMIYNMTANVVNVFFNYCLIYGHFGFPAMGVAGASLATIIGQFVAFAYAMFYICSGKRYLHLRFRDGFAPDWEELRKIVKIGIPSMIEQLVMRAGMIVYAKTVASLGTVAYATHQVCMNIQAMSFMSGQAFAVSATSLVGQSLGKKRPDMAQAYCSRTRRVGFVVAMVIGIVFFFFGGFIVGLYNDEKEIVVNGAMILKLVAFTQPFQSSQFIVAGGLRGAGDTRATAVITFVTMLLIRPGVALILIKLFDMGLLGAWIAMVCDQIVRTMLVFARYQSGKWKTINKSLDTQKTASASPSA